MESSQPRLRHVALLFRLSCFARLTWAQNVAVAQPVPGQSHYITVQGSPYKSFDLVSLFLGCEAFTGEGVAGAAIGGECVESLLLCSVLTDREGCQMSVECLKADGSQAGTQSFGFFANPIGNNENATMQKHVFNIGGTTYGVQTCIFGVTASALTPDTTTFLFDNLTHIMHS